MNDNVRLLLEVSNTVNSKAISLTRCLLLTLLLYFVDGLQYRELKATLKVSDGKLISNLNQLRNMGYVKKSTARLERKKLDIYYLTPEGKKELVKVVKWMKLIQEVTKDGDLECQTTLTK